MLWVVMSTAGGLTSSISLPLIHIQPAGTLIVSTDKIRRHVRCALLLDLYRHACLVVHNILGLDGDHLHTSSVTCAGSKPPTSNFVQKCGA